MRERTLERFSFATRVRYPLRSGPFSCVAAWAGGLGPSLICQTLILFANAYWFSETQEVHSPMTVRGIVSLIAFYSVGGIVGILSEAWQAARKRAIAERDAALSQREHLRATLSCVGDGVLVTDAGGRVTIMNPIAEELTGWTLNEAKGKPVRDIFAICDEASQEIVDNPVPRVLHNGAQLRETMCLMLTMRNDRRRPISYSAAPIRDARNNTTGVVLIFRDETERRRRMSSWPRSPMSSATRWRQFAWAWNC
jgi:PAS domain S-box-containing protein